ncbi:sugar phosphate isomerase/epimerase family protein [Arthrobacter castelli]|uniref:sugar phosphate isomerase/epimerase family protein n=1 Tax=Arthrobacter castelli TaxID=271431 RepID=UPI0003FA9AEA|nr:sugar phosphate isomerase/epimerase family protein [Arthrobacter castelli]
MKISVFPKGELDAIVVERSLSVPAWIRSMSVLPIEGVELYSGMFDAGAPDLAPVQDVLAETGLEMPMFCASPDFTHPSADVRSSEFERQVSMMRIARDLGGPGVSCRVLSGQRHPEVTTGEGLDWAAENINALLPLARELDIVLGLENHYKDGYWSYPEFAQKREVFLALLNRIEDRKHFGVQFDPSNATVAGDDPVDFLQTVIDRVVTMQASDRTLAPGASLEDLKAADGAEGYSNLLRHGAVGEGLNDYPAIFGILDDAGYDGWISIEDGVNGFEEMARSVDFLVEAREQFFSSSRAMRVRAHDRAPAAE